MNIFLLRAPLWAIRLSLGLVYLYSGVDIIRHPKGWYWAVSALPFFIQNAINSAIGLDRYLLIQGISELILAGLLFAWFLPRRIVQILAAVIALEMGFILLFVGIRADTFRDIGLFGEAIALLLLTLR